MRGCCKKILEHVQHSFDINIFKVLPKTCDFEVGTELHGKEPYRIERHLQKAGQKQWTRTVGRTQSAHETVRFESQETVRRLHLLHIFLSQAIFGDVFEERDFGSAVDWNQPVGLFLGLFWITDGSNMRPKTKRHQVPLLVMFRLWVAHLVVLSRKVLGLESQRRLAVKVTELEKMRLQAECTNITPLGTHNP